MRQKSIDNKARQQSTPLHSNDIQERNLAAQFSDQGEGCGKIVRAR